MHAPRLRPRVLYVRRARVASHRNTTQKQKIKNKKRKTSSAENRQPKKCISSRRIAHVHQMRAKNRHNEVTIKNKSTFYRRSQMDR